MDDNAKKPESEDKKLVKLFIPRGNVNDEPNQLIGINGVNYLLPKGKTSKVPDFVAQEYYRSVKAQETLDTRVDQLLEAASKK